MTFEEFIKMVVPKIGPNSAFDLSRDAQLKAIGDLLVEKGVLTKEELEAEQEKCLGETAESIIKMPPIPTGEPKNNVQK